MTSGLKILSVSNINITLKLMIATSFLSFGGISIHMQVLSIMDNKKIRYLPYLEARILQSIISSILVFITYNVIVKLSVLNI